MGSNETIGVSAATPHKHDGMRALFSAWTSQVEAIMSRGIRRRVCYVDLTVGDGTSPFLHSIRDIYQDIECYGFERDIDNYRSIERRVPELFEQLNHCDWQDCVQQISGICKGKFSFIFLDPTRGWAKHLSAARDLSIGCPKADIAININTAALKRIRRSSEEGTACGVVTIDDLIPMREHGLIRTPFQTANNQEWSIIFLSNCPPKGYAKYGFHELGSKKANASLNQLRYTLNERQNSCPGQRMLF